MTIKMNKIEKNDDDDDDDDDGDDDDGDSDDDDDNDDDGDSDGDGDDGDASSPHLFHSESPFLLRNRCRGEATCECAANALANSQEVGG